MTLGEFKAWLEGYEESFATECPSLVQWRYIKEKLSQVKDSQSQFAALYQSKSPAQIDQDELYRQVGDPKPQVRTPSIVLTRGVPDRQRAFDALAQRQHSVSSEDIDNYLAKENTND